MTNCFSANDNPSTAPKIFRTGAAPQFDWPDKDAYEWYPVNAICPITLTSLQTSLSTVEKWPFVVGMRNQAAGQNQEPSYIQPIPVGSQWEGRTEYSSYQRANVATRCIIMAICGESLADIEAFAVAQGYPPGRVVTWEWANDNRQIFSAVPYDAQKYGAEYRIARDWIILNPGVSFPQANGIMLDWEVQHFSDSMIASGVARQSTNNFMASLAVYLASKNMGLAMFNTPLESIGAERSGVFPANSDYLANICTYFGLMIYDSNRPGVGHDLAQQYAQQLNLVASGAQWPGLYKIMLICAIKDTSVSQAQAVRTKLNQFIPGALYLWMHGAPNGGACSEIQNQVISALVL